jgi:BCD family chlorophyll transporter-like MFS transporter
MALNILALWKQETAAPRRGPAAAAQAASFASPGRSSASTRNAMRRLVALGLGTMAFSMQDVLLEPYGGQILGLNVSATTLADRHAGRWAGCWASGWLRACSAAGPTPSAWRAAGALLGMPAFWP